MAYKIKVCGMKYPDNIEAVAACGIDYIGFIFYEKSKRYVGEEFDLAVLKKIPTSVKKAGVFVNHSPDFIEAKAKEFELSTLQLHGDESVEQCALLKAKGYSIVKVFQVDNQFDFKTVEPYKPYADFFLFDTKSEGFGGTGKKFDWELLKKYDNEIPLFLSGGLDIDSVEEIKKLSGVNIHALDLNSKFEVAPGKKDVELIKAFISKIK